MEVHRDDFDQILQSCLDELQAGQETIDSILARYPDLGIELRPLLEAAQWVANQKEILDPRPGFVAASRWRLVEQIRVAEVEKPPSVLDRMKAIFTIRPKSFSPQLALAVVTLLVFFCGAAGATFGSQSAIPGDWLYPIKLGWEEAALALTPGDVGDARLDIEFVQRRMVEIQALALEGRYEQIPVTVTEFEESVSEATEAISDVARSRPAMAISLARTLKDALTGQAHAIASLMDQVPQQTKPHLARLQLASQVALTAVQDVLALELNLPGGAATATPTTTPTPTNTSGAPAKSTPTATPTATQTTTATVARPSSTPGNTATSPAATETAPVLSPPISTPTPVPPTHTPRPSATPKPSNPTPTEPEPTPTSPPPPDTSTPIPTPVPPPTSTPQPTPTEPPPAVTPTSPPKPTNTPKPTHTPRPTFTPRPT